MSTPTPQPPRRAQLTAIPPRTVLAEHADGVETLPDHVQFVLVGRYRDATEYRLLAWLRETDDATRVLEHFTDRNVDVHWERRTSVHHRVDPADVAAERDVNRSVREHFRERGARDDQRRRVGRP